MKLKDVFTGGQRVQKAREMVTKLESHETPLKPKDQRRLQEARAITRAHALKLIFGGVVSVAGAVVGGSALLRKDAEEKKDVGEKHEDIPTVPRARMTPIEPVTLSGNNDFERMIQLQDAWKKISMESLSLFRNADPRMPEVIDFMQKNAFYSIPMGPVVTQFVSKGGPEKILDIQKNPHSFEVVYMPEQFAGNMPSSILTEAGGKTMRVATTFRVEEWLGIMLAHELTHVEDQLVRGENSQDPQQYFAGEVRAHLFEMNLLRSWNPEGYKILVEKGISLFLRGDLDGLIRLSNAIYPVLGSEISHNESSLAQASCIMAVAFEEAKSRGVSQEGLAEVYQQVVKMAQ